MGLKVLGIDGSSRKAGNTAILLHRPFAELHKEGMETELVHWPATPSAAARPANDEGGLRYMQSLGENIAWLLRNLHA